MQFAASFNILVMDLVQKRAELRSHLQAYQKLLVAYSGGIDSAYLAWEARQVLGTNILAVIADSPSLARAQLKDAVAFAQEQGIPLEILATSEMDRPDYVRNDGQRCFHCKDELFTVMEAVRHRARLRHHCLWRESRRSGRFPSRPACRAKARRRCSLP